MRKLPTSDKSTQSKKLAAGRAAPKQPKKPKKYKHSMGGNWDRSSPPKKKSPEPEVEYREGGKTYK